MLEEIEELIKFIQIEYGKITNNWEHSTYYEKINLKNNQVYEVIENKLILDTIIKYREFISENNIDLMMDFKKFNSNNATVNSRTKAKNSIEFKIKNYIDNHENGKVPINKCFNDLFGIRTICNTDISFDEIFNLIDTKYDNLKCIDSSIKKNIKLHMYTLKKIILVFNGNYKYGTKKMRIII